MVMKVIDGYDLAGRRRDVGLSRRWLAQPGCSWRHLPTQ